MVTIGCIGYNAFNHNWQLLALWLIVTSQSFTIGAILLKIKYGKYK
jgi:hypothetical protein|tara:strand:+ start:838 stop:975 length:138 start_codon:yes stop_codon:yes gene_type:complete